MRDRFKRYRATILLGSLRLRKLVAKREKLNLEIERVSELIIANANFLPDEQKAEQLLQLEQLVADPPGFTDSVRKVLRSDWRSSGSPSSSLPMRIFSPTSKRRSSFCSWSSWWPTRLGSPIRCARFSGRMADKPVLRSPSGRCWPRRDSI